MLFPNPLHGGCCFPIRNPAIDTLNPQSSLGNRQLKLLYLALADFALGDFDELVRPVVAGLWGAAAQQLLGTGAGHDHELEPILPISINHCAFL
jgi:hypothetical protein